MTLSWKSGLVEGVCNGICNSYFLCGFMDEKVIKLLYFSICLACWTSLSGDIFNLQQLFKFEELT